MSGEKKHCVRQVRINRIERLETRDMLSADGLSCDHFHDPIADELSRAARILESTRASEVRLQTDVSESGRRRPDSHSRRLDSSRDQPLHHHRSQSRGLRHDKPHGKLTAEASAKDSFFGGRDFTTQIGSIAEGEFVPAENSSSDRPQQEQSQPLDNRSATENVSITFVVILRNNSVNSSTNAAVSESSGNTVANSLNRLADRPQSLDGNLTPTDSSAERTAEELSQPSINESQVRSPSAQGFPTGQDPDQGVQLVSVLTTDARIASGITSTSTEVVSDDNPYRSSRLEFSDDSIQLDDLSLDRWVDQSEALNDDFAELESLLDSIAIERAHSASQEIYRLRSATAFQEEDLDQTLPIGGEGMILLLPESSLTTPSIKFATQTYWQPDDPSIDQWTVGVGFYRALELAGETRFADAVAASELATHAASFLVASSQETQRFEWQLDSSSTSRNAAGIVFCCLGIRYLQTRRRAVVRSTATPLTTDLKTDPNA